MKFDYEELAEKIVRNPEESLIEYEDEVLCKGVPGSYRIAFLNHKYHTEIRQELTYEKGILSWHGLRIYSLKAKNLLHLDVVEEREKGLYLGGHMRCPLGEDLSFFLKDQAGKKFPLSMRFKTFKPYQVMGKVLAKYYTFSLYLPKEKEEC